MGAKDHFRTQQIDGRDNFLLTPPNIKALCEPLMGFSARTESGWRANYLPLEQQVSLFAKALHIVVAWNLREDLLNLALYRRQVETSEPISIDEEFLNFACSVQPPLTPAEWEDLETRMPKPSFIHGFCRLMARGGRLREAEQIAAE